MTGQRRDQSPTRADVAAIQLDPAFTGQGSGALLKFNPLAAWSSAETWAYIREHERALQRAARARLRLDRLRALHAPDASRPARARGALVVGRSTKKECGLHSASRLDPGAAQPRAS